MKIFKVILLPLLLSFASKSQSVQRIHITSATDALFPEWDFSAYLNDSLNKLVPQAPAGQGQFYSTVVVTLESKSIISSLSLYNDSAQFSTRLAYFYSINGNDTTFIGKFAGDQLRSFTDIPVPYGLVATKIAIRKFGNNIPQKIKVYGTPFQSGSVADPAPLRIGLDTIIPALNTGMDYRPWMNDSLSSMVISAWGINLQYTDVKIKLKARCQVSKISVYDYTGVFTTNPAYIYLQKDTTLQLVGIFQGLLYQQFVNYLVPEAQQADAVIIRKFGNNIPQKVQVYGRVLPADLFISENAGDNTDTSIASSVTKIPIEASRWYILNYAPAGIGALFNGVTNENINTGYAGFNPVYDCIYPLNDGEAISLKQIKMFDYNGIFSSTPVQLFAIKKDGRRISLGTFTGTKYNEWVGPYPERNTTGPNMFNLDSTVTDIQYIVIRCTRSNLPTEMEFYGAYKPAYTVSVPPKNYSTFGKTLGMNGFEWDFVRPDINSRSIAEDKYVAIKNFRGFRHYLDWKQMEGGEGEFRFNPSKAGGWDYDMTYQRCKRDSIEVLACIKNIPDYMRDTYPDSIRSADNAPLKYGKPKDSVQSYIEYGRMAFQFTARYGRNSNIASSLIKVNTNPRWTSDPPNTVKKGLGLVKYIECGNELDKWWRGAYGYMNAYQYAALLSAFYDGHKGVLGSDVGVKTADSTMQVVIGGLATNAPSYIRAMIEWCRQNRGYKADGKINLCWDVINYHDYSTDAFQSPQGTSTRAMAPEVSDVIKTVRSFVNFSQQYANNMPVWITELGFDLNQGSPAKVIAIGNKSILQTQADWTLRSSLTYLREGIGSVFYYGLKDYNINSPAKFASMGLTDSFFRRRPAMDYLYQANGLIGSYRFNRSLQQSPMIDEYENAGKFIYAVWVPDEKGITVPCSLSFPFTDSVIIYTPVIGSDSLHAETVAAVNGSIQLVATETPLFVAAKESNMIYATTGRKKKYDKVPLAKKDLMLLSARVSQTNNSFFPGKASSYSSLCVRKVK